MDATPISFDTASPLEEALLAGDEADASPLGARWAALHQAAEVIAALAGVPAVPPAEIGEFPGRLAVAPPWRRALAEQGIEDIRAMMTPGIAALIAVNSQGRDVAAPARALWREFLTARDGLAALAGTAD